MSGTNIASKTMIVLSARVIKKKKKKGEFMRVENWRKASSLKLFLRGSGLKGLSKVQQTVCITSNHDNIMWQVFIIIL